MLVLAAISATDLSAQQRASAKGRVDDYVTFYASPGFQGASFSVESAGEISNLNNQQFDFFSGLSGFSSRRRTTWDNVISSIAFNGAFRVTLFKDRNFQGGSVTFNTNQRTIPGGFDNQVSSLTWEPLAEGQGQPRVIFYDRINYQGNSFILYPGESIGKLHTKRRHSRRKDWDDEIRSVRVIGADVRLTLYADKEYRGRRVVIRSDADSLIPIGFAATASSLRITGDGPGFNTFR